MLDSAVKEVSITVSFDKIPIIKRYVKIVMLRDNQQKLTRQTWETKLSVQTFSENQETHSG